MSGPILVTGATGNVGRAVTSRLGKAARPAVHGCAGLFLLRPPAIARMGPPLNRLVDAAAAGGVRHCAFLSVAGADRNPVVPHRRVERHLRGGPMSWTILRPGFFADNLTGPYRADIRAGRLYVPAGDGRVAFVDARDLGELAAAILLDPAPHAGRAWAGRGDVRRGRTDPLPGAGA